VPWLNLNKLSKSLQPELMIGERLEIELVKPARKTPGDRYLADGSMVVVTGGRQHIGQHVVVEIISLLPTGAGKMIFARMGSNRTTCARDSGLRQDWCGLAVHGF